MLTTCLQFFTHGRQARLSPLGGLFVQCAPRQPLLPGSCEKIFRMLELNVAGMVDVRNVINGDPPNPIGDEGSAPASYLSRRWGEKRRKEPFGAFRLFRHQPQTFQGDGVRRGETSNELI